MKTIIKKQISEHFKSVQMKKVLIALDYDHSAKKVAEIGYSLAKSMNAQVILLHIIEDITYYSSLEYSPIVGFIGLNDVNSPNLIGVEKVKAASKDFLDKLKHHLDDKTIQTFVDEGDTADVILKTAAQLHADIIILGTHSRKGLEKILMGSVAEKVLHHTSKPVFIIPTKKDEK